MTTSALARRGSKCAATACNQSSSSLRPFLTTTASTMARRRSMTTSGVVSSSTTPLARRHRTLAADMFCFLAAAAAARWQGAGAGCARSASLHQRRAFSKVNARSAAAAATTTARVATVPACALDDPRRNAFHPRRIGKGCDLDALFAYLRAQGGQLGPERVYKTLRSALYNAGGYQADAAWRIYQAMHEHGVAHRMGANHYGHLLNILKYKSGAGSSDRMVAVLEHMRAQGTPVGPLHYGQVLFAMARQGELERVCKLLRDMADAGVPRQPSHLTSLALAVRSHHVATGQHETAAQIMMDAMQSDRIVLENRACAVMVSHLSRTSTDKTIQFLESLAQATSIGSSQDTPAAVTEEGNGSSSSSSGSGSRYNAHVYTSLISGLAHKGDAVNAERLYNDMRHHHVRPTVATRVALAEAYGRAGDFDKALKLLDQSRRPNLAIMTSILSNAMRQERWSLAMELADTWMADERIMKHAADDKFRATLMWVKVKAGLDTARAFFQRMYEEEASFVNAVMVNHLVIESGNQQRRDRVVESFELHQQVGAPEAAPPLQSQHFYVDALFKCRDVPAALAAFVEMRRHGVPDDITMAMVVRGLVMNDEDNMAWNVFRALRKGGLQPNLHAYTSIIKAFAKSQSPRWISKDMANLWPDLHAVVTGRSSLSSFPDAPPLTNDFTTDPSQAYALFQEMTGFQRPNEFTYTTLIACFAKSSLARAADVFSHMCADGVQPTVQTYTAMLQACAIFRNARMALIVFRHMRDNQVTPNEKTWHYLLKALVRARVDRKKIDHIGRMARKAMDVS